MVQSVAKTADKMPVRMNQLAKDVAEEDSIGYRIRKEGRKSSSFQKDDFLYYDAPKTKKPRKTKVKNDSFVSEGNKDELDVDKIRDYINESPIFYELVHIDDVYLEQRHLSVLTSDNVTQESDKWLGEQVSLLSVLKKKNHIVGLN